ncbi:Imm1 family immunity protein [Actinokineospora sp. NBRC 105648]|uniref:Imm1 family immunity protein n=1 Tax=Actinokineospora sp. NBRC 105648 TaxID=3032206 RepID=UPI0024A60AF3|nr:Imm1 family immunity protein [Actinokineospora sp. NBRC 105648]GLZ40869.1 hypothetical protein Acsp05_44930 [Actinokineospora sp. NBRC 105648]
MTAIEAWYLGNGPDSLRSVEDVIALVGKVRADSLASGAPLLMSWYLDDDDDTPEFGVGVNGAVGIVSYTGRQWPGLWVSRGGDQADTEVMSYDYMGNERPVFVSAEIPYADVVRAATEFFRNGGDRPASVAWQKLA